MPLLIVRDSCWFFLYLLVELDHEWTKRENHRKGHSFNDTRGTPEVTRRCKELILLMILRWKCTAILNLTEILTWEPQ